LGKKRRKKLKEMMRWGVDRRVCCVRGGGLVFAIRDEEGGSKKKRWKTDGVAEKEGRK